MDMATRLQLLSRPPDWSPKAVSGRCRSVTNAGLMPSVARHALPWVGLLIVLLTITHQLNSFATELAPTASAVSVSKITIDHVQDNATLRDDAVVEQPARSWSSPWRVVTISGRDTATGEHFQVQCTVDAGNTASDVLVVDFKDFSDVVSGLCE
jgi:hypothetical protein